MWPSRPLARSLARGLGWFGIALGVAELLGARSLSRAVGQRHRIAATRAAGLREVATGVGLLNSVRPAPWMWARVAGDALDIATLVAGRRGPGRRGNRVALAAVAGVALADLVCARRLSRPTPRPPRDYSRRSGFPLPAREMRGAALQDFAAPADLRTPEALRSWTPAAGP